MTFKITVDGFKTKEEANEFMNWVREEGEDLFRDHLEKIGMEPEKEELEKDSDQSE